ncbi:hypothetical protein ACHAXA_008086 [Cyclostephanos tholiformis]|uniref:ENTH domain-containing protein n=1 Tax=Cyclostephanos tholiformis TaxID=382380 RepID=A0ABD3RVP2_9STRA
MDLGLGFIKDLNIDKVRNLAEDAFNQVKPKNDVEARVYEVLSHKNWGASTTLMNEIAQDTFDYERFLLVTKLMWEAIETPRPSAWRVIFKGLTLLEHLLKNGSERCVDDARNHSHLLRNLDRFNYYEGTVDRGVGVREKSKQVVEILQDDERIREERQKARQLREKFSGRGSAAGGGGGGGDGGKVKYEGYGNSDAKWASSSGGGAAGGGGYGDGGIGSGGRGDSNRGYAGRYGEGDTAPSPRISSPPAAVKKLPKPGPSGGTKVKKAKKKERAIAEEGAAAAPEVDLFSFDLPASASHAPPAAGTDSFDAFQAAPVAAPPAAAAAANDDFGDFRQIVPASFSTQFDAFGTTPSVMAQPAFDAFGPAQTTPTQPMTTMNNAFGSMTMSSTPAVVNAINGPPAAAADNDDFGDFEDADPVAFKSAQKSSDPLSALISLDGLSKNPKKEVKPDNSSLDFSKPLGTNGGTMMGGQQQVFEAPLVLGTGKKGDVGEVFGELLASTPSNQHGRPGMVGMAPGGNYMMGGQQMYPPMQMGMGQPQQGINMGMGRPQQAMMFNPMMGGQPQGNLGMMGANGGMMVANGGMMVANAMHFVSAVKMGPRFHPCFEKIRIVRSNSNEDSPS